MPSQYHAGKKQVGNAVQVFGLTEARKAIKRTDAGLSKQVQRTLRAIATPIREAAKRNAPVQGEPARSHPTGTLRDSIRISVTQRFVSVFSTELYSKVIDMGGKVGRNHATILPRNRASRYMTRAQQEGEALVEARLEELAKTIEREMERD